MANYSFSSITAAQALAFNAATDTISSSAGAIQASVTFDDAHQQVTVSDGQAHTVVFGAGVYGARMMFNGAGLSYLFVGSPGGDFENGGVESDSFYGGDGADTIVSGLGGDVLHGGPGADLFTFVNAHPTPVAPQILPQFISDWESKDSLYFSGIAGSASNYQEATAPSDSAALQLADQKMAQGAAYVAVAVGGDVYLFADSKGDGGGTDTIVRLLGRTLADIDASNIVGGTAPALPATDPALVEPTLPNPLLPAGPAVVGSIIGDIDNAHLGHLQGAQVAFATPGGFQLVGDHGDLLDLGGFGFTYDQGQHLTGGLQLLAVTFIDNTTGGPTPPDLADAAAGMFQADLVVPLASVAPFVGAVQGDTTQQTFAALLSSNDELSGTKGPDLIRGYDGADILNSGGGDDTIFGGTGNDIIRVSTDAGSPVGQTYLRGEEGDDYIVGGAGFDDANGNMGNDTISTGAGDDFSVGGKDNDLLFGDDGNDIVWGNLGNDTCDGGAGNDQVRGGQGDDVIFGGAGNDFISGDRGNDTEVGGAGADIFHGSQDAGIDRVLDFHVSEGDRVELDPGTTYTVSQVGADTVIDMGASVGGAPNQMILVGVQMSSLHADSIFLG